MLTVVVVLCTFVSHFMYSQHSKAFNTVSGICPVYCTKNALKSLTKVSRGSLINESNRI